MFILNRFDRVRPIVWSVVALLLSSAIVGYLAWRFVQAYLANLDNDPAALYALLRYLLGGAVALAVVCGIAHLHYKLVFVRLFTTGLPNRSLLTGLWLTTTALLWFGLLEWRTQYESEFADENVLLAVILAIFTIGYSHVAGYAGAREKQTILLKEKTEAELMALKAHIKPHFLFNILNTIFNSAQKHEDHQTAHLIQELSDLLRFSIQDATADFIPVSQEIAFIERYIGLQRVRLPAHKQQEVQAVVEWDGQAGQIAPLLLIPFIENAFQYGISLNQVCSVNIRLHICEGGVLLQVTNSIAPNAEQRKGVGTGIRHVRTRLALLYPGRHTLDIAAIDQLFTVSLELRLR
jgi:Histidine kinase